MDKKLIGKVALVSGASKGIGAGIAKELAAQGASVVVNYVSDRDGANKVVTAITAVNNAGIYGFTPIGTITDEIFWKYYNINVLGTIHCIQEAIKVFGEEGGSIINVGSSVVTMNIPGSLVYTSSKYVMDATTRMLAKELAPKNIRVNSINAGSTETEGTVAAGLVGDDPEKFFLANTPLGRTGKVDDIAKVAGFLASDDARWITGELIAVAGGIR